jgi:type IX secretion system PorP/SprF family membrane protein
MFNGLSLNPAYAGVDKSLSLTFLARMQNVGLEGAPNTQTFSAHTPVKKDKIGLGLQFYHETIGVSEQTNIYAAYSYMLRYGKYTISLGLQGGVNFFKADYSQLLISDPGDPVFQSDVRSTNPNFGAGLFVSSDLMWAGLSMPQMLSADGNGQVIQEKPVFLYGGYVFELTTFLKLRPSTLMKMVNGQGIEWNINASILFNDLLWVGASYRPNNAIVFLLELQATEQLMIGYAYDANINELSKAGSGSHELMLRYRFLYSQKGVSSPRYF